MLHAWDFAGHPVYQATHSYFLSERTIYVVCYNANAKPDDSRCV